MTPAELHAQESRDCWGSTGVQGDLFEPQQAVLQLMDGDPSHARDKAAVIQAVKEAARVNGGRVSRNHIAPLIPEWVQPQVVGSTVSGLRRRGVLSWRDRRWDTSDDEKGRNAGKPCKLYEFNADRLDGAA